MQEKIQVVKFPVFNKYPITIIKTTSIKKSVNKRSKILGETIDDDSLYNGLTIEPEDNSVFIFITHKATLNTIVHESYHAIKSMMRYIGADEDEEVVAYHLGYLVQKITKGEWFRLKYMGRLPIQPISHTD
jgi:hypothetical protein